MATKEDFLSSLSKNQTFTNSFSNLDNRYSNLNLNRNQNGLSAADSVTSKSISNGSRTNNYDYTDTIQTKSKNGSKPWNKSDKDFLAKGGTNFYDSDEQKRRKQQKNKNSSLNNSTLSLHISAYENSNEANNGITVSKKVKAKQNNKTWEQLFTASTIQNPFEFPRYQPEETVEPEVMQLTTSQILLNPNELNCLPPNTVSMEIKRDVLFASFVDTIYVLTAQPLSYQKLCIFFAFYGQPYELEETCRQLGYKTFNDCIRENKEIFFKFLDIYASKKDGSFILYYQNREIKNKGNVLENLRDKTIDDGHILITFDETANLETQNDPRFFEGRKKFAQAINYCTENPNLSGLIRMHDLTPAFQTLFNEVYSKSLLKAWFPSQGNLEQILQNILFEEIEFEYEKQEIIFRLREGLTIDKINEDLDALKRRVTHWLQNLDRKITEMNARRRATRNGIPTYRSQQQQQQRFQQPSTSYNRAPPLKHKPAKSTVFADSDSEDDTRVENRAYTGNFQPRKTSNVPNKVDGNVVETIKAPKSESLKVKKDETHFVKKYTVTDDMDLDELFNEAIKESQEAEKIVKIGEAGSSKVVDAAAANAQKIKIAPSKVAQEIVFSRTPDKDILNPTYYYKDDATYTDYEADDHSDDDDSSIALKPMATTAAVKENNEKSNRSSESDGSFENHSSDDLLNNSSDMSLNKSNQPNPCESSEERKPSPLPLNPGSDETPSGEHKPPKKFMYLTGHFQHSQEISKAKKEEHRRVREQANGTNTKKKNQMVPQLPIAGARVVRTTPTPSSSRAITAPSTARPPPANPVVPPVVASNAEPRNTPRQHTPEHLRAAVNRPPPQNPVETVRNDRERPYNYAAPPMNPTGRRPAESGRTQHRESVEPQPTHPPRPVNNGGFKIPHNLPKHVNTVDDAAAVETHPDERQNYEDIQREVRRHPDVQPPIPRRSTASPILQPRSNSRNANTGPPVVPRHAESQLRQIREEYPAREEAIRQLQNRRLSQNSIDPQFNDRQRPQQHDYRARPQSNANGYGDNHREQSDVEYDSYGHRSRNNSLANDVNNGYERQPVYHDQRENRLTPRQEYVENWVNNTRNTPLPPPPPQSVRDEYPPLQHSQDGYRQQQYPQKPPPQQQQQRQSISRQQYYREENTYAVPNRPTGFQPIDSAQHYPQNGSRPPQQQQNYYALSENGYRNPQEINRFANHSPYQQHPHRPISAYPPPSSYNSNSLPRPLSVNSAHINPADYRNGSGSVSVIPRGVRLRQAPVENEIEKVLDAISLLIVADGGYCDIQKIGKALIASGLPPHPQYIQSININNWKDFIATFFQGRFVYYESSDGDFLIDPTKCDFE